jgi:glycosyltransferase involved in cell wall biosynthesis
MRSGLDRAARAANVDVLFAPGGLYRGGFRPFVTMSRNMLPFDPPSATLYGWSIMRLRLAMLTRLQTATFRGANGTIFLTEAARRSVQRITGPLQGLTRVVPHGVSERYRQKPRPQRALGTYTPERPFRLLYVSIVDVYKHQWVVVDAVSRLRRAGMPVVLELIGPAYPPALDRLRAAMRAHDPSGEIIHYLGDMPNQRLHEAYERADAFVFASSCENMPNILLEAMAAGLPIACSDRGVMPEVIGDAGEMFDPQNADSAAAAIGRLVSDTGLRERLAAAACARAASYSWETCARQTFEFLNDVRGRS